MERSGWKNKEKAREFEVTDQLFEAVYEQADQVLRDALDIATATGYRVQDVLKVPVPNDGLLRTAANKTGKKSVFDISHSPVLTAIVSRRQLLRADHVMLLSTPTGRPVTYSMIRTRWESAGKSAAEAKPALADQILAM